MADFRSDWKNEILTFDVDEKVFWQQEDEWEETRWPDQRSGGMGGNMRSSPLRTEMAVDESRKDMAD